MTHYKTSSQATRQSTRHDTHHDVRAGPFRSGPCTQIMHVCLESYLRVAMRVTAPVGRRPLSLYPIARATRHAAGLLPRTFQQGGVPASGTLPIWGPPTPLQTSPSRNGVAPSECDSQIGAATRSPQTWSRAAPAWPRGRCKARSGSAHLPLGRATEWPCPCAETRSGPGLGNASRHPRPHRSST
jgi:hypothetical protein